MTLALIVFAIWCHDQYYKTGNVVYQLAIWAGILVLIIHSIGRIKKLIDDSTGY
jgi:hypothetical protein